MIKKIIIGNETIEVDTEVLAAIGENLTREMDQISALIASYGAYLAAAKKQQIAQKARYRHWKAKFKDALFKNDPKLADAKATNAAEADETFLKYKEQEAECVEAVEFLDKLVDALKEKSPNLRSRGAWARKEFESTGMTTTYRKIDSKKQELRETNKRPVQRASKQGRRTK